MKKPFILLFSIFFYSAALVLADPSFKFIEDDLNLTGAAKTLTSSFKINNTGTTQLNINFSGLDLIKGSDEVLITDLGNIVEMGNGTIRTVTFSLPIPQKQSPGLYVGTLTANSNSTSTGTDTLPFRLNVTSYYSVASIPELNFGKATLNTTRDGQFNITNNGNADITGINLSFSDSKFSFSANKSSFTLPMNKTEFISFNLTIAPEFSTGNISLGTVKMKSTEFNKDLFNIKAEVGGGLIIEDLDVFLTTRIRRGPDGSLRSNNENDLDVEDGDRLNFGKENAGPGSELRFNFNIENTFSNKDNIDINDITAKLTIIGIDDSDDIEVESNEFDLDAEESKDFDLIVKIPLAVDEGNFDIEIEVLGEDNSNNEHRADLRLTLDIDKDARDLVIYGLSLFPNKVICRGSTTLTTTIKNIGKSLENEIRLDILNEELGIAFSQMDIELEEDPFEDNSEYTKRLTIEVTDSTPANTYPIKIMAYMLDDVLWETATEKLIVEECTNNPKKVVEEEQVENKDEQVQVNTNTDQKLENNSTIEVLQPDLSKESSFIGSPIFWVSIILLNIIITGGAVILIVKAVGKK